VEESVVPGWAADRIPELAAQAVPPP